MESVSKKIRGNRCSGLIKDKRKAIHNHLCKANESQRSSPPIYRLPSKDNSSSDDELNLDNCPPARRIRWRSRKLFLRNKRLENQNVGHANIYVGKVIESSRSSSPSCTRQNQSEGLYSMLTRIRELKVEESVPSDIQVANADIPRKLWDEVFESAFLAIETSNHHDLQINQPK